MSSDLFDVFSPSAMGATTKYYSGPYYSNYVEKPDRLTKNSFWIALGIVALVAIIIIASFIYASKHIVSSEDVDSIDQY